MSCQLQDLVVNPALCAAVVLICHAYELYYDRIEGIPLRSFQLGRSTLPIPR